MRNKWVKVAVAVLIFAVLLWLSVQGSSSQLRKKVEQYKAQLREAGEKTTVEEITPPSVPAEKNALALFYAANPVMGSTLNDCLVTNPPTAMRMVAPGHGMIAWHQAEVRDSSQTNQWQDVRDALNSRLPAIDFYHLSAGKERLQFDLDFSRGFSLLLPHLARVKHSTLIMSAAVLCDLQEGNTDSAVTNLHDALVLVRIWDREPLLISQLVRFAMVQILYSTQWELLKATNLSDSQLALLQTDWERMNLLDPAEDAFVGERVLGSLTVAQFRTSNAPPDFTFGAGSGSWGSSGDWWEDLKDHGREVRDKMNFVLWKSSWSYDDELLLLKSSQVTASALRQVRTNGFYKDAIETSDREVQTMLATFQRENRIRIWMADSMADIWSSPEMLPKSLIKLMTTEAAKQLAITAIALKRFELKHKQLPTHLDELVPDFVKTVPRDPVDGQPLRYRLNNDHSFTLYSIGENGIDDGGSATNAKASKSFSWQRGVDWVWPQPATAAEVEAFLLTH